MVGFFPLSPSSKCKGRFTHVRNLNNAKSFSIVPVISMDCFFFIKQIFNREFEPISQTYQALNELLFAALMKQSLMKQSGYWCFDFAALQWCLECGVTCLPFHAVKIIEAKLCLYSLELEYFPLLRNWSIWTCLWNGEKGPNAMVVCSKLWHDIFKSLNFFSTCFAIYLHDFKKVKLLTCAGKISR